MSDHRFVYFATWSCVLIYKALILSRICLGAFLISANKFGLLWCEVKLLFCFIFLFMDCSSILFSKLLMLLRLLLGFDEIVSETFICRSHRILVSQGALSIGSLHISCGFVLLLLLLQLWITWAPLSFNVMNHVWLGLLWKSKQILLLDWRVNYLRVKFLTGIIRVVSWLLMMLSHLHHLLVSLVKVGGFL